MLTESGSEASIRLGSFLAVFILMALWELINPRRKLSESKPRRWFINLGLTFINVLFTRVTVGTLAFSVAIFTREHGWGLFNYLQVPAWFALVISVVILDFTIYLQHIVFHAVPLFWRLHRVHHTDLNFDVTTGLRFHSRWKS
ncbi:MAG: sterol desaturase family protein [Fidelibacterota bacterium]